jgi:type II secretory pathway component PulF
MDDSASPRNMRWPAIVAVIQGAVWGGILWLLLWKVPRFEAMFRDFKMELPTTAKLLIGLGHVVQDFWILAVMLLVVWMALNFAVVLLLDGSRPRVLRNWWYLVTALMPMGFLVVSILAIALPTLQLVGKIAQ